MQRLQKRTYKHNVYGLHDRGHLSVRPLRNAGGGGGCQIFQKKPVTRV